MSTELESIIRPFQTGDVTPAQTYYMPGQIGVPPVILRIGRDSGGTQKKLSGSVSQTATFYCVKYENESEKSPDGSE